MNFKMKPIKIILFLALFFSTVLKTNAQPLKSRPHVIVELFTAEGCSSCPAADELLKEMPDILNKENKNVIGLSFHVTYWNKSGWEDPYSNELFTDRQKKYVAKLNLPQLYTPQAIVNGEKEFIGSNPLAFRDLVTAASEKNAAYEITAQTANENDKVLVNYELNRDPKNIVMNIAIVEKDVVHYIPRGENKGRAFETIDPQRKGNYSIIWPTDLEKTNSRIILYAQNIKTMKVTGSTIIDHK
jgi:hypothetical protein